VSDWGWVAFAYSVVYTTLALYLASIVVRARRVRRSVDER
jgi:hypothetical protein